MYRILGIFDHICAAQALLHICVIYHLGEYFQIIKKVMNINFFLHFISNDHIEKFFLISNQTCNYTRIYHSDYNIIYICDMYHHNYDDQFILFHYLFSFSIFEHFSS